MNSTKDAGPSDAFMTNVIEGLRESPRIFFAPLLAAVRWLGRIEARLSHSAPPAFGKPVAEPSTFAWNELSAREQYVWTAVFAASWDNPGEGIRRADLAVEGLRLSNLP